MVQGLDFLRRREVGGGWFHGERKVVGLLRRLLHRMLRVGLIVVEVVGVVRVMSGVVDDVREGIECGIHHLEEEKGSQVGKHRIVVVQEEQI